MVYLLYLLIKASSLLLLRAVVHAEEPPDLTLISDYYHIYCIARNETSAIALAGLGGDAIRVIVGASPSWSNLSGDVPLCNTTSCVGWQQNNFIKKAVNQLQVQPLLNFYWEELDLVIVQQNEEAITYELSSESWLLDISVLAKRDVYFNISSKSNISFYWVILGGWKNTESAIRILDPKDYYVKVSQHKGNILNKDMWLHFRLSWDMVTSQFQVIRWGYNDNQPFLYCNITSPQHMKIFTNIGTSLLRLHTYDVWSAGDGEARFEIKEFTPKTEMLCFIVTYNIQSPGKKLLVVVNSKLVHTLQEVGDSWKDERIVVNLDLLLPNWREETLHVSLRTTSDHGDIYVAGIQECNPQGDTRMLKVKWPYSKRKELYFNLVRYNQSYALADPQKQKKDCRDTCPWSCMDYIPSLSSCSYTTICKASKSGNTSCFCSPGYKGGLCASTICPPVFGDAVTCINRTVNSVTLSPPVRTFHYCYYKDVVPTQYRLEYRNATNGIQQKWEITSPVQLVNNKDVTIEGLHHATKYEIRAVVGDEYGYFYVTDYIASTICATSCTAPYVVAEPSETSIILALKELDNYTCPFQYVLICARQSTYIDIKHPVFNVTSLRPFTTYYYQLKMVQEIIQNGTVRTTEGAPGPPVDLQTTFISSTDITICWYNPHLINGILRAFVLEVKCLDTKLRKEIDASEECHKTHNLTVTAPQPYHCYAIKDLLPSTRYEVSVCGLTVKFGPCESLQKETSLAEPEVTPGIDLVKDSITSTSFDINLPPAYPYLTETSAYFLILTSEDDNEESEKQSFAASLSSFKKKILEAANLPPEQSWIIDELQLPTQRMKYTIGEEKVTNGTLLRETFRNRPLQSGTSYNVTLVLVNQDGKVSHFATSSLPVAIRTAIVTTSAPPQSDSNMDNGSSSLWLALLILLVLLPVAYFIYRRKKKTELKPSDTLQLSGEDFQIPNEEEEAEIHLEDSPSILQQALSQKLSRRVAISELETYVKTGIASGEFQRQHSLFPRGQTKPWAYGKKPQNTTKNRYGNLVAYDETRVKLKKLPNDEFSDYINANYIDGYNSSKCYIATQGPKPNTVNDFWRMVWQEQVYVIAMLTNVIENGKRKCEQYWPELGNEKTFGSISVHNIFSEIFADYIFRQLNVTHKGKTRKVHHLHFTSWPDHGVPLYPQSVAMFLKKMLATPPGSGPIVVHCSAGVGRTGTIILADICLRMAAAEGCVDVLHYQQQIREQRANLVDNVEQYKLVHLVLLECLVEEPNNLPFNSKLPSQVAHLHQSGKLQQQFKRLGQLDWQDKALAPPSSAHLEQETTDNEKKNRFQQIIPGSKGRVFISRCPLDDASSDYINAVYVDGFRAKNQFIATQFPLECTIQHFWRLIVEKSVGLVIVLNEVDLTDKSVCQFWPLEEGKMNPVPDVMVIHRQQEDNTDWVLHNLSVTDSAKQTLKLLQVKGWAASSKLPPSPELLLKLWQESERLYMGKAPIVVTCYDGATACGLFLALSFMIEKIKLEQQCDPYHAVRTVRQNRACFIPTLEQFCFLYDAAVKYLDDFQTYANFQ